MRKMANLRQKTWGIFIKPYMNYGGDKLVYRGGVSAQSPCRGNSACQPYEVLLGGEGYMLHKTTTSFVEVRKIVKTVMDELGYSRHDILVTEIIPINHIITPLT